MPQRQQHLHGDLLYRNQRVHSLYAGVCAFLLLVGLGTRLATPAMVWGLARTTQARAVSQRADHRHTSAPLAVRIDALLSELANNQQFSGSVLVAQGGRLLVDKGYSLTNWDTQTYNLPDTRFYLGSLTKAFTALAILMLQEQGKLQVQAPLCTYIPNCPAPWQPLSVQQLLTHTSGIPQLNDTQLSGASPAAWIASFNQAPLQFTSGGEFQYCSICYQILGYVVQQVSGVPYTQFIQQMILDPLQMGETGFDVNAYYALSVGAQGYESWRIKALPSGFQLDPPWSFLDGSGLLYSSVNDLYRWDQALYTSRLVSQVTLNQLFTPYANASPLFPGSSYGYGWFITQAPIQDHRLIWHDGVIDGFRNYFGRSVDDDVTVIILSNLTTLDAISLGHQIESMIF
ncbi:MAG TPA: serine hydrolase domain-containing protein [Ktedonobacteraceae bacterium]